jgi:hypothetical protein
VGQLLALIEPVPADAIRAGARDRLDAVTPDALVVAALDVCEPGSLVRSQVARAPVKAIAQFPVGIDSLHTPLPEPLHV